MTEGKTIKPFDAGGYFPIHNYVFDVCMPKLSNAGWRVLCVAIRQTWGWIGKDDTTAMGRKKWDEISYSQFLAASGLRSSASISKGLQECLGHNYLTRRQVGVKPGIGSPLYAYSLNVDYEAPATVSEATDTDYKIADSETKAGQDTIASENELGIASVFEDTKVKEKQTKDESKDDILFPDIWGVVLNELALQMSKDTYNSWLRGSRVVAVDNGIWTVQVENPYAVEWVDKRLRSVIERTMNRHQPGVELEFVA